MGIRSKTFIKIGTSLDLYLKFKNDLQGQKPGGTQNLANRACFYGKFIVFKFKTIQNIYFYYLIRF